MDIITSNRIMKLESELKSTIASLGNDSEDSAGSLSGEGILDKISGALVAVGKKIGQIIMSIIITITGFFMKRKIKKSMEKAKEDVNKLLEEMGAELKKDADLAEKHRRVKELDHLRRTYKLYLYNAGTKFSTLTWDIWLNPDLKELPDIIPKWFKSAYEQSEQYSSFLVAELNNIPNLIKDTNTVKLIEYLDIELVKKKAEFGKVPESNAKLEKYFKLDKDKVSDINGYLGPIGRDLKARTSSLQELTDEDLEKAISTMSNARELIDLYVDMDINLKQFSRIAKTVSDALSKVDNLTKGLSDLDKESQVAIRSYTNKLFNECRTGVSGWVPPLANIINSVAPCSVAGYMILEENSKF